MSIPYASVQAQLYQRVASDPAGGGVRSLVGSAASVFPADQLGRVAGTAFPWLVWAVGPVGGVSGGMRDVLGSWWAYDDPGRGPARLLTLASAIDDLYGSRAALALPWGRLGIVFLGRPVLDTTIPALALEIRIGYRRLG